MLHITFKDFTSTEENILLQNICFFYLYILYNNLISQKKKNNLFLQLIRIQELIFFMEEHKIYIL